MMFGPEALAKIRLRPVPGPFSGNRDCSPAYRPDDFTIRKSILESAITGAARTMSAHCRPSPSAFLAGKKHTSPALNQAPGPLNIHVDNERGGTRAARPPEVFIVRR